jgi:signal transduction histidine kinase
MRLGTKITVLTLSSFIITVAIAGVSVHLATFLSGRDRFMSDHPFLLGRVETIFLDCEDRNDFSTFPARLPQGVNAAVLDAGRVVLASSFPNLPAGSVMMGKDVFSHLPAAKGFYFVGPVTEKRGDRLIIIHLHDARNLLPSPNFAVLPALFILILLLTVSVVLTRGMLGSTYRAIASLSSAASRIAAGELDFQVEAHGRDELGRLSRDFDGMRRALREDYDRRARFLMGVSHDLKTPLTSIRGYVEAMQDGLADDPRVRAEYLKVLDVKSQLLEDRLVELLDFGRMETGEWRLKLERIPLREFLEPLCREFEIDARLNGRRFACSLDVPEETAAAADLVLFARVLENLVGNAVRYTRENDRIDLSVSRVGGPATPQVVIEIRDSGRGIEPKELSLIFEPFFRGTRTRSEPGFGLGLSIVKSIVEAHGWSIVADSHPEGGTTFRLTLPVENGAADAGS